MVALINEWLSDSHLNETTVGVLLVIFTSNIYMLVFYTSIYAQIYLQINIYLQFIYKLILCLN